ncbi:MAG: class I SAM-dependent methyltransferase [Candidatus Bathyarchaeota archaeon]|nr:class I SAM-dependent methyltransferase [Candidatus Bathyarchaeota archaeon]
MRMVEAVNWVELRQQMILETNRIRCCTPSYWNNCAQAFSEKVVRLYDLTEKQLSKLPLLPDYTVLDVGAGTGRITIPVAKRVKHVTAVEPSKNMLALLKANLQKEQLNTVQCLNRSLEDLRVGVDVALHDVVIASFSLFMVDIEKELAKLDALASRSVYLFLSASDWVDREIQGLVYRSSVPVKLDYIYVYNILHDMGILANVEIWDYESPRFYDSLDESVSKFAEQYSISSDKNGELKAYLKRTLREVNGKFWQNRTRKTATIWWTKPQ